MFFGIAQTALDVGINTVPTHSSPFWTNPLPGVTETQIMNSTEAQLQAIGAKFGEAFANILDINAQKTFLIAEITPQSESDLENSERLVQGFYSNILPSVMNQKSSVSNQAGQSALIPSASQVSASIGTYTPTTPNAAVQTYPATNNTPTAPKLEMTKTEKYLLLGISLAGIAAYFILTKKKREGY